MTREKRPLIPLLTGMGLMLIASAAGSFGLFGAGFVLVVWAIAWHLKICNQQQQHKTALRSYKRVPRNAQSSGAKPYTSKRTQPDKRKTYPSRPSQTAAENKPPQWYFPPDKPVEPPQEAVKPHVVPPKGGKPYAGGEGEVNKRKTYPVNGDNRVEPSPQPQGTDIPERIIDRIARMNLDRATAIRLLEGTAARNPGRDWGWVAEKVLLDLERDRLRG